MVADLKLGSVGSEVQPMSEGIASFTCFWSLAAELITSTGKLRTKRGREERGGERKGKRGGEMREEGEKRGRRKEGEKRGREKGGRRAGDEAERLWSDSNNQWEKRNLRETF